jgi:hypothetical protein
MLNCRTKIQVICFLLFGVQAAVYAQFTDISNAIGNPIFTTPGTINGNGMSFYDFNHDGWDDLTISRGSDSPQFYINQQGTFVSANFSIPTHQGSHAMMIVWIDYDNDGDEDLFITKNIGPIELWNNDGNFNFINVAAEAGFMPGNYFHDGAAWADYDHDGCLDVYISKHYYHSAVGPEYESKLYKGNCDGTFSDVTYIAGVYIPSRTIFQPVFYDFDNNGWEDLMLIIDNTIYNNVLFRNLGNGTFTDVSQQSGAGVSIEAMSATVGDFDNDADSDLYITNRPSSGLNVLLVSGADNVYSDQASLLGVGLGHTSWGANWLDYDNDSWQDLFVSVPFAQPLNTGNEFYINSQGQGFTPGRDLLGFGNDFSDTYVCAKGDINNDGYFDLAHSSWYTTPFKLFRNDTGQANNYLSLSLEGTFSNRNAIGSRIHCYAQGNHYTRYTHCGANLLGQDSRKEIFGLSNLEVVDSLVIDWSRGTREVYYSVAVNQHLQLIEGFTLSQPFEIDYAGDLYLCEGDSMVLDAGEFDSYAWNTGEISRYLTVFNAGVYSVIGTNQFGFQVESFPVEVELAPVNETQLFESHISCLGAMDGALEVSFSNSPAQNFIWNTGDVDQLLFNLESGYYSFLGKDSYGCAFFGNAFIEEPVPLSAEITVLHPGCYGFEDGAVTAFIAGGTAPYNVEISGFLLNALPAGIYDLQITDSNDCPLTLQVELFDPEELVIDLTIENIDENGATGSASIVVSGGTGSYNIFWSTGEIDVLEITNLISGNYLVAVTDQNGCVSELSFEIMNTTGLGLLTETALYVSPNPFTSCFNLNAPSNAQLILLDTKGITVYYSESNQYNTYCLAHLPAGTYLLLIQSDKSIERIRVIKF